MKEQKSVADFGPEYDFVVNSQDINHMFDSGYIPKKHRRKFDSFFVLVGEGEYTEIWGIQGIVPNTYKIATRVV